SVYEAVGGHQALRSSVVDDVRLGACVKGAGYRLRVTLAHDRIAVRMYEGFREVWDGFTKNVAYAFGGWFGAFFLAFSLLWTFVAIVPPILLLADAVGAPLPNVDVVRAAVSVLLLFFARVILSVALKEKIWPALAHPLMAAVWAAIILRSLYHRLVRRRLVWRRRAFDGRPAGF